MLPYLPPNHYPYPPHPSMEYYPDYMYNPYPYGYGYPDPYDPYYCYPYDQHQLSETIPSFADYDPNQDWRDQMEQMEGYDEPLTRKSKDQGEAKKMRPKKNVESNISNQVFSYLTSKSKCVSALEKILKQDTQKIQVFFTYMEQFVKYKKKYLSRKYLGDLCTQISNRKQYDEVQKLNKLHILSLEEFRSVVSFLIFHYLRSKCTVGVLTSSKLSVELRREHLERKREILSYLEEYVQPDRKYRLH